MHHEKARSSVLGIQVQDLAFFTNEILDPVGAIAGIAFGVFRNLITQFVFLGDGFNPVTKLFFIAIAAVEVNVTKVNRKSAGFGNRCSRCRKNLDGTHRTNCWSTSGI